MTVEDHATLRVIVVPTESATAAIRAGKLLDDLGHQVIEAKTPDHALGLLQEEPTDLLVVDLSGSIRNRRFVENLSTQSSIVRPRQLAIFTDAVDEDLRGLRNRMRPCKVHVFLKPLHMHGLLGVVRQLDRMSETADA